MRANQPGPISPCAIVSDHRLAAVAAGPGCVGTRNRADSPGSFLVEIHWRTNLRTTSVIEREWIGNHLVPLEFRCCTLSLQPQHWSHPAMSTRTLDIFPM